MFSSSRSHFCRRLQQAAEVRFRFLFRKPASPGQTSPPGRPVPPGPPGSPGPLGPLDQFHSRRLALRPLRLPRPPRVGIQIPLSPSNLYLSYKLTCLYTHSTSFRKLKPISFHVMCLQALSSSWLSTLACPLQLNYSVWFIP
jgi:hypothetical protein